METTIGYMLSHEQFSPADVLRYAIAAEKAGFEAVCASDHFQPWQDNQGHAGQAWITLAAIAQATRLSVGTAVTCPGYRYNPAIIAHAFATLGTLYPGRVFLGLGTGEAVNELPAGGGWGPYRERAARLRESATIIRRLWNEDWVTFEGDYLSARGARIYDKPPQPVPIFIAASGPKSAALAAELGDGWITDAGTLLERPGLGEAFRSGWEAVRHAGRPEIVVEMYAVAGDRAEALTAAELWRFGPAMDQLLDVADPREVQRLAGELSSPEETIRSWVVSRDPTSHVERIRSLIAAGATQVYVHSPQGGQQQAIEFYGRYVLPHVSRIPG